MTGWIKAVVIVLALLMVVLGGSGCSAPDVVDHPVSVSVPVPVPCKIKPVAHPAFATNGVTGRSPLWTQVTALAAANDQHVAYEKSLTAAVASCQ